MFFLYGRNWSFYHFIHAYDIELESHELGVVIVSWLVSDRVSEWVSEWVDTFSSNYSNDFDNCFHEGIRDS